MRVGDADVGHAAERGADAAAAGSAAGVAAGGQPAATGRDGRARAAPRGQRCVGRRAWLRRRRRWGPRRSYLRGEGSSVVFWRAPVHRLCWRAAATAAAGRRPRGAAVCGVRPYVQGAGSHDGAPQHACHVRRGRLPVPGVRQGAQGTPPVSTPSVSPSLRSLTPRHQPCRRLSAVGLLLLLPAARAPPYSHHATLCAVQICAHARSPCESSPPVAAPVASRCSLAAEPGPWESGRAHSAVTEAPRG